jgi:cytochrome d ubiquinol oxidase subunit I
MAFAGVLMLIVAAVGAWLYWKRKLESARWFHMIALASIALPYVAATAGWILTEMGRQPWIVQGLLLTRDANSPSVSTTWLVISLGFFIGLYVLLGVVDFVLMRRYAKPGLPAPREELPSPAVSY